MKESIAAIMLQPTKLQQHITDAYQRMALAQLEKAARLREAHHKRFIYEDLGPALTRPVWVGGPDWERGHRPHRYTVCGHEPATYRRGRPVPHMRQHRTEHKKKYDAVRLRELRDERGCGHLPKALGAHGMKLQLWCGQRIVHFDVGADPVSGAPMLVNISIHKQVWSDKKRRLRMKRDVATQSGMTDEQFHLLLRMIAEKMKG